MTKVAQELTPSQQAILADKLQKQAERAAKQSTAPVDPTVYAPPVGDSVNTAPVAANPLSVGASGVAFLVEPRGLNDFDGLSDAQRKADAAYTASLSTWLADRESQKSLGKVDDAETITLAECRRRRDAAIEGELTLAQRAVAIARDYVAVQQARLPELRDFAAKQAAKLVDVTADVVKRLNAAGVSVETQPGAAYSPDSAAIRFSHTVKQSAEWQKANEDVSIAENQVQSTASNIAAGKLRVAEAEKSLLGKVAKLIC